MESFLDLNEICEQQSSSYALKLVPWLNWDEWVLVKDSLFSDSPDSIAFALKRISAWESRGCLPAAIEATASIIEIRQIDPYCRVEEDRCRDTSLSEKMLAHLYCMAIIRLVNGVIEKTRKKEEKSIAVAAEAIGIPRLLIDIRHEGSHRGLPALQLLRSASVKALDWLKSYYWESQSKAIPFERDGNAKVRKKIKSKLRELSFCLKSNQSSQSNSPILEGKRSKKQVSKISKSLVQLYSSYSSEIVGVLLEYLLEALSSSELVEHTEQVSCPTINIILPDWKVVILRFCDKEPELLLNLFKEVLIMIETQEAEMKYEEDDDSLRLLSTCNYSDPQFCMSMSRHEDNGAVDSGFVCIGFFHHESYRSAQIVADGGNNEDEGFIGSGTNHEIPPSSKINNLPYMERQLNTLRRYNDDVYDRIWHRFRPPHWDSLNTSAKVKVENSIYELPSEMLLTACQLEKNFNVLNVNWSFNEQYYVFLHFTEIQKLPSGQKRIINVTFDYDENSLSQELTLEYLKPITLSSKVTRKISITFRATVDSDASPILNAYEIYRVFEE
ncbi:uncharacterized protein LOC129317288 [Prosopis cineraria]|uniref:uncharacterized protein LOC129317288 n=1 Tax=Prosopis cineraria TaxID=364024 RepID=UPI00240F10DC|nr:uncharacterized protein LOC129317288 [Prosopis cineraria]